MSETNESAEDEVLKQIKHVLGSETDLEKKKKFARSAMEVINEGLGNYAFQKVSILVNESIRKERTYTRSSTRSSTKSSIRSSTTSQDLVPVLNRDERPLSNSEIAAAIEFDNLMNEPWMWCITLDQLNEIGESAQKLYGKSWYEKANMYEIVDRIVKPVCEKTKRGYWASKNPKGLKVTVFVTHSWKENFKKMVESMNSVFINSLEKPNLWICAFALIQGDYDVIKQQVSGRNLGLQQSPFVQALEKADFFLVVRNSFGDLYARIWCVCELIFAMEFGLVPSRTLITGPDDFAGSTRSCMEAEASVQQDKDQIIQHLTLTMSPEEVDEKIKEFREMKLPTQTNFSRLFKFIVSFLVLIIVAAAIAIPLGLTSATSTENSTENKLQKILESEAKFPAIKNEDYRRDALNWLVETYGEEVIQMKEEKLFRKYCLSTIYFSTVGKEWVNDNNWLIDEDECNWYGIRCSEDGDSKITEFRFNRNKLRRRIPDEIGFLQNLRIVDIANNNLIGVSEKIASIPSLTSLWLHNNELTGNIPEKVNDLVRANQWYYSDQILKKFPSSGAEIFSYGNLRYWIFQILVYQIEMSTLREDHFLERYALYVFYYVTNGGSGWNREQNNWLSFESYCGWFGVGCNDENKVNSLYLDGFMNLIGTMPKELGALEKLTFIGLVRNSIKGSIPTEIGMLTSLTKLDLSLCQLTGKIPDVVGLLTGMSRLVLSSNELTGDIPPWIDRLTNLTYLTLANNNFEGEIPSEVGLLTDMTNFELRDNELRGEIPIEILSNMTSLTELDLSGNILTGEIPSKVGQLTEMKYLRLEMNELSGSIPSEIGLMTKLTILDLEMNQLTGKLPSDLSRLTKLEALRIDGNNLSGSIPDGLCNRFRVYLKRFLDCDMISCCENN